jgi:NDP-sugar pyrophosphorylase family protein
VGAAVPPVDQPTGDDWRQSFSIVEDGAAVDPAARIIDSVVLRGARVEAGAALVRSVICPGAAARKSRPAVDELITASDHNSREKRS